MDHQKMWEGHRVILPEMRGKVVNHCKDCRFFVSIQGAHEIRTGCVANIEGFRKLWRRVPETILVIELMKVVGSEGLKEILKRGDPDGPACERFMARVRKIKKPPSGGLR